MEQKKESVEKKQVSAENNTPPKPREKSNEKWIYGLAGAGIGSLVTYLLMENKNKREKEQMLSGIRENEAEQNIVKRKITFVLK